MKMVDKKQEWKPFEDARVFVRSLKLRGAEEWEEYRKSGKRPNDIPSNPDKIYKNDGWIDIGDWLGTGSIATKNSVYLSFNERVEQLPEETRKNLKESLGMD